MGFSEQVKQNPSILSAFNVLDFSNRTNIKYVGGSCKFNHQIFNEFQVQKIDLSNLIFLPNASGQSASTLFYGCNFSSCIQLNLFGVDFATIGTNRTAYYTFSYANLSGLAQLDLSNTMFAANNMTSGDVYTAYYTFSYANLSGLVQLDLSNTVFAANNMTSGDVYTAYYTFDATNLSGLDELDLSNTIFTISGMTTSESVFIAHYTFYAISLNDLSKIYLPNYDSSLPIWSSTFNNHTVDSAFIIYGYDSS
jgi:uncharacterized protein YjbI with pentapeptide repeats